jgi:hypothetical protein
MELVTIENGRITAKPPQLSSPRDIGRATTISEEKFYEQLAANMPAVVPRLKAFVG